MRAVRDTFLNYLSTNLPTLTIHPVRRDVASDVDRSLQTNAVNVQFLNDRVGTTLCRTSVTIDVINVDENTCLDMVQKIYLLLTTEGMTPKFDYSFDPPAPTDTSISWSTQDIQFRFIYSDFYCRYSLLLVLTHIPTR